MIHFLLFFARKLLSFSDVLLIVVLVFCYYIL